MSATYTNGAVNEARYSEFVAKQMAKLVRNGQSLEDAERNAESICSMYRHQFREPIEKPVRTEATV